MNAPTSHPTIHDIKVTPRVDGHSDVVHLDWTDRAGAKRHFEFAGQTANHITLDLHACTLIGEAARQAYLIGVIRMLERYAMDG